MKKKSAGIAIVKRIIMNHAYEVHLVYSAPVHLMDRSASR